MLELVLEVMEEVLGVPMDLRRSMVVLDLVAMVALVQDHRCTACHQALLGCPLGHILRVDTTRCHRLLTRASTTHHLAHLLDLGFRVEGFTRTHTTRVIFFFLLSLYLFLRHMLK